jgi:hypothetical protein
MRVHYSTFPRAKLDAILASQVVTPADLAIIRDHRDPNRYYGVYQRFDRKRASVTPYRARVLRVLELGCRFSSAREAATAVVAWYKHQYGVRWVSAFHARTSPPWRVKEVCRPVVWSLRADKTECIGYRAEVFVNGTPRIITHHDAGILSKNAKQNYHFASTKEARIAAKRAASRLVQERQIPIPALLLWRG